MKIIKKNEASTSLKSKLVQNEQKISNDAAHMVQVKEFVHSHILGFYM